MSDPSSTDLKKELSLKPIIRDLPKYIQFPNGCGLASLLMLIDPPNNPEILHFLDYAWERLKGLFEDARAKRAELRWAIVLQYVLLKCVGYAQKDALYEFLTKRIDSVFEDQRIITKFNLDETRNRLLTEKKPHEAYCYLHYLEEHDFVLPLVLRRQINIMKTDIELKILAELFNYQFLFQESEDMTGAVYFSKDELAGICPQTANKKWLLLESISKNPANLVLWGKFHHWLAVRTIYRNPKKNLPDGFDSQPDLQKSLDLGKYLLIAANDPASGTVIVHNMDNLKEADRFYCFVKRPQSDYRIFAQILNYIQEDLPEERKRWAHYLKLKKGSDSSQNASSSTGQKSPTPNSGNQNESETNQEKKSKKRIDPWG